MTTATAKSGLEAKISQVAGIAVELTIRGLKEFTFHFEGRNDSAAAKITRFFAGSADVRSHFEDDELGGFTCIYVDVK
jgi:hypothetical protein